MTDVEAFLKGQVRKSPLSFEGGEYVVDDVIEREATKLLAADGWALAPDPYDLEGNAGDVGVLLDRLLAYRREISAIEAERIRTWLGYAAAVEISKADAAVEWAKGSGAGADLKAAVDARTTAVQNAIALLEERHATRGSPLNFVERIGKLEAPMLVDLESLLARTAAVVESYGNFGYGDPETPPVPGKLSFASATGARFLDDMCLWHRKLSRGVEKWAAREMSSDLTLSLGMDFFHLGHWRNGYQNYLYLEPKRRSPLQRKLLETLRNLGRVTFSLHESYDRSNDFEELPSRLGRNLRIKALALTASYANDEAKRNWRFQALVYRDDEQVHIANVGPMEDGPDWVYPRGFVDRPAQGDYNIDFSVAPILNAGEGDAQRLDRANWPITDLQLHLRLVSLPRE